MQAAQGTLAGLAGHSRRMWVISSGLMSKGGSEKGASPTRDVAARTCHRDAQALEVEHVDERGLHMQRHIEDGQKVLVDEQRHRDAAGKQENRPAEASAPGAISVQVPEELAQHEGRRQVENVVNELEGARARPRAEVRLDH